MNALPEVLAVVVVRDGALPGGADETVAETGGAVLLAGTGTARAAKELRTARSTWTVESAQVGPGSLAATLGPLLDGVRIVLLPASPDGRDLAPRLAFGTGRTLHAGAIRCGTDTADLGGVEHPPGPQPAGRRRRRIGPLEAAVGVESGRRRSRRVRRPRRWCGP